VRALEVYDDGSGPALYVGGEYMSSTVTGVPIAEIAKWDGSQWSSVGTGVDFGIKAMAVFDGGAGPELVVGGFLLQAGSSSVNRIAKWNGTAWSPLGSGMDWVVDTLTAFDIGSGPQLFAGGGFSSAGGVPVENAALWDGSDWSSLGPGLIPGATQPYPQVAFAFDDSSGTGPALFVGGAFGSAGIEGDSSFAKWGRCQRYQYFCDPAELNSAGLRTRLEPVFDTSLASGLHLDSSAGPPTQFGYILVGLGVTEPGIVLGSGRFCLNTQAAIGRYNVTGTAMNALGQFDGAGIFQNASGTSTNGFGFDVPLLRPSIGGTIQAGQVLHFQLWHREPAGNSNLSNGVSITF